MSDAYEQMKQRDRAISHQTGTDATALQEARDDAERALDAARRALTRLGGSQAYADAAGANGTMSPEAQRAAGMVAGAAAQVSEASTVLGAILLRHESALAEVESAKLRLVEAEQQMQRALEEREKFSGRGDGLPPGFGSKDSRTVQTDVSRSAYSGRDAYEAMRAADRAASMAPVGGKG